MGTYLIVILLNSVTIFVGIIAVIVKGIFACSYVNVIIM